MRLRFNSMRGALGASLSAAATTLTFSTPPTHAGGAVPTISPPDYLPVSILDAAGRCAEIVYLTGHTGGSTTATIVRAQEGTVASEHDAGRPFVHGPTAWDASVYDNSASPIERGPLDDIAAFNARFGSTVIYDYEFDATSTSLPSGWSWVNQGAATYREYEGCGLLTWPRGSGYNLRHIVRTPPAEAAWVMVVKLATFHTTGDFSGIGIILGQSSNNRCMWLPFVDSARGVLTGFRFTGSNLSGYNLTPAYGHPFHQTNGLTMYLALRKNTPTSYDVSYSFDGETFQTVEAGSNLTTFLDGTIDRLGIGTFTEWNSGQPRFAHLDWVRIRA